MFQDLDLSLESGRSHVPSQAGLASTSIASSSISLRKQLLLVMRQLSEDIESVSECLFSCLLHISILIHTRSAKTSACARVPQCHPRVCLRWMGIYLLHYPDRLNSERSYLAADYLHFLAEVLDGLTYY